MKRNSLLLAFVFLISAFSATAQRKDVGGEISAGLRAGGNSGVTLKKHSNYGKSAFEFIGQFDNFDKNPELDGFSLTALFQKLAPLSGSSQLSAFIGGGPSMNFKDQFDMGVSGIIGFDWRLKGIPITLQADWMPTWFFIGENEFVASNVAVSARFVLNRKRYKRD